MRKKKVVIPLGEILSLQLAQGWFFASLEIKTENKRYQIKGLPGKSLSAFIIEIQRMALEILQHSDEWRSLMQSVKRYKSGMHYFSSHEWQALGSLLPLKHRLRELAIDETFIVLEGNNPIAQLALSISTCEVSEFARKDYNQQVVPKLLGKYGSFFDTIESQPLSQPQRQACVTEEDHTLVVAGAGTGKTSTIIGKAGYLLHSGLAEPDNILLLAFGNKAAGEMTERIALRLPEAHARIRATTFHAFGNQIMAEIQGKKPTLTRFAEQKEELRKFIETVMEQQIIGNTDYKTQLIKYFVCYSTPGRCEYDFENIEAYYEFLESCRLITLKGEFVKSVGELRVANYLHLYSVPYEYEVSYAFNTATVERRRYKPDFYLPNSRLYIEYLGLDRKMRTAPFVNQTAYIEELTWKRHIHQQCGTRLAELYSYQLTEGTLEQDLLSILDAANEPLQLRDMDILLTELRESSLSPWQGFIDLLLRFLGLFKEGQFTFDNINEKFGRVDVGRTQAFFNVV